MLLRNVKMTVKIEITNIDMITIIKICLIRYEQWHNHIKSDRWNSSRFEIRIYPRNVESAGLVAFDG